MFYRLYDGSVKDVNFSERMNFMDKQGMESTYGGDGSLMSCAQVILQ